MVPNCAKNRRNVELYIDQVKCFISNLKNSIAICAAAFIRLIAVTAGIIYDITLIQVFFLYLAFNTIIVAYRIGRTGIVVKMRGVEFWDSKIDTSTRNL